MKVIIKKLFVTKLLIRKLYSNNVKIINTLAHINESH